MEKMNFASPDQARENMARLKALFPSVVTEARIDGRIREVVDYARLEQLLAGAVIDKGKESYQFTWPGKREAIAEAGKSIRKTLRPCPEESLNWDTTENLYIEGDNLDVLRLLQENYLGKVKMIYIDPPYNTGNDFIYKDDFSLGRDEYQTLAGERDYDDEGNPLRYVANPTSNGQFHSDWCSMIYPRLMLARNLLANDGAIFISIDDNEQENLKKICDEIFGRENFVAQLVWEKKKKGAFLSKNYINMKEYILVYSKNNLHFKGLIGELKSEPETYPCIKTTNARGVRTIKAGTPSKYKEKNYKISAGTRISAGNMELVYVDDLIVDNGILQKDVRIDSNWIYSQEALDKYMADGSLYITQDNYIRRIVTEDRIKMLKDLLTRVGADGGAQGDFTFDNNLNNGGWGTNEDANRELHNLLGQQYIFDFSKPVRLIGKLIQTVSDSESIILDFFSGSGTTAHAVMRLNAEDGGRRKFIMVQLPETCGPQTEAAKAGYQNICEIAKERIRRAGAKIKSENAEKAGIDNLDTGFRVFKCDSDNMKDVYYTPVDTEQGDLRDLVDNVKEDRGELDLLFGCILAWNLPLSWKHETENIAGHKVHFYDGSNLACCFEERVDEDLIKELARREPLRVVFRGSAFAHSQQRINAVELFNILSPKTEVRVI